MFGISGIELLMIVAFALIVFGPDKLPEIAKTVGKFMRDFKRMQATMESMLKAEMFAMEADNAPAGSKPLPKRPRPAAMADEDDEAEEEEGTEAADEEVAEAADEAAEESLEDDEILWIEDAPSIADELAAEEGGGVEDEKEE